MDTTGPRADGCSAGLFGQRAVFVQFKDPEFQHNFYSSMHQEIMHPAQGLVNVLDRLQTPEHSGVQECRDLSCKVHVAHGSSKSALKTLYMRP